jgi:alpha-tubulin suppressor-like RCC1 family protein
LSVSTGSSDPHLTISFRVTASVHRARRGLGAAGWILTVSLAQASCASHTRANPQPDGGSDSGILVDAPLPAGDTMSTLALGGSHACATGPDRAEYCWGYNSWGQLGDPAASFKVNQPVMIQGLGNDSVAQFSLGDFTSCVRLADDSVKCWGKDALAEFGDGVVNSYPVPQPLSIASLAHIAQLAHSESEVSFTGDLVEHGCARLRDGSAMCWGSNSFGELGLGQSGTAPVPNPTNVPGLAGVIDIAVSSYHTCAVLANGTVECWGLNDEGALGDGTRVDRATPAPVTGLSGVRALALGFEHSCALTQDGNVWCWGVNDRGELGDGTNERRLTPQQVPGLTGVVQLASMQFNTCARRVDASVVCWGDNGRGQRGDGTTDPHPSPSPVPGLTDVTEVGVGVGFACARRADMTIWCWGDNLFGELGVGDDAMHYVPTQVHW